MTVNSLEDTKLLTRREAADFLRVKEQTLSVWACHKHGPAFHKVGRTVRYKRVDLEAFVEQGRRATNEQK